MNKEEAPRYQVYRPTDFNKKAWDRFYEEVEERKITEVWADAKKERPPLVDHVVLMGTIDFKSKMWDMELVLYAGDGLYLGMSWDPDITAYEFNRPVEPTLWIPIPPSIVTGAISYREEA